MISARPASAALAARLTRKAATLAAATAEMRLRARRRDQWRWRKAGLLWPLFNSTRSGDR